MQFKAGVEEDINNGLDHYRFYHGGVEKILLEDLFKLEVLNLIEEGRIARIPLTDREEQVVYLAILIIESNDHLTISLLGSYDFSIKFTITKTSEFVKTHTNQEIELVF